MSPVVPAKKIASLGTKGMSVIVPSQPSQWAVLSPLLSFPYGPEIIVLQKVLQGKKLLHK